MYLFFLILLVIGYVFVLIVAIYTLIYILRYKQTFGIKLTAGLNFLTIFNAVILYSTLFIFSIIIFFSENTNIILWKLSLISGFISLMLTALVYGLLSKSKLLLTIGKSLIL